MDGATLPQEDISGWRERKKSPSVYERSGKDGNFSLSPSDSVYSHHFTASEDPIIYFLGLEDDRKTSAMVQGIECIVFCLHRRMYVLIPLIDRNTKK